MRLRGIPRAVIDLASVSRRFISDDDARAALRIAARTSRPSGAQESAEWRRAPAAAAPYAGLTPTSLSLASLTTANQPRALNVVVGDVQPGRAFAGVQTVLLAAAGLGRRLGVPLRVILLEPSARGTAARTAAWIDSSLGCTGTAVVHRAQLGRTVVSPQDVWLASHSRSAHAIHVATLAEVIDPRRVVYLIQDYEPGFSPWSTEWVVASSTYHAGFLPLVNSAPLARYLEKHEQLDIDRRLVFGPAFDDEALSAVAASRRPDPSVRVLFYARPSKPRNLFDLGIAALRGAIPLTGDVRVAFRSAGERHPRVHLGAAHHLHGLGQLSRAEYFDELARTDVVLSLQQSPHPSHVPLEAAVSGARTVTNLFTADRAAMHPRLDAVTPDAASLAAALARAIETSDIADYAPVASDLLGMPLDDALDTAVEQLLLVGG